MKTTKKSALDDHKLSYEDMPLKKPKKIIVKATHEQIKKLTPKVKRKRFNPIKEYLKAIVEVILK